MRWLAEGLTYLAVFWFLTFLLALYIHDLEYSIIDGTVMVVCAGMAWGLDRESELL